MHAQSFVLISQTEAAEALQRYTSARERGVKPSTSILLSALKACTVLNDVVSGTGIHNHLLHTNSPSLNNIFLSNALIDMYSKCGCLPEAHHVFENMPFRSTVSWNTIIMGYAQAGKADEAFQLFSLMQDQGYVPDARTFVALLKGYTILAAKFHEKNTKNGHLEKAHEIHRQLSNLRLDSNRFVSSSLVDLYVKCGSMSDAWEVFETTKTYDTVLWNTIILGYAQNGEGELSLQLFRRMQEGYKPDERTFVAALNACARLAEEEEVNCNDNREHILGEVVKPLSLERGMAVHSRVKLIQSRDPFLASALVDMYSKCGSLEDALRVFESMQIPDVVSWNALLVGYTQSGQPKSTLDLFSSQQLFPGFEPDVRTYTAALKACSSLAEGEKPDPELGVKVLNLERGMAIHSKLSDHLKGDLFVESVLLDMYSKCSSMIDALGVFEKMKHKDVVSWNTILSGYVETGESREVVKLFFTKMDEEGVAADVGTYSTVVKACGSLAEIETGRRVHARVKSAGLDKEKHVANSLVSMYGRCGAMEEAQEVFDSMEEGKRDLFTWSALVAGYCHQGDVGKVFKLVDGMVRERRVEMDGVIFLSVLMLCCHAGLVDRGREYFRIMCCEYEIAPGIEHFTCMVDMLGKANYLDEALAMVKSMPFEGDVTLWTVLLDACRKWKNVEVGRLAFDAILKLNDKQPGAYILMADSFK